MKYCVCVVLAFWPEDGVRLMLIERPIKKTSGEKFGLSGAVRIHSLGTMRANFIKIRPLVFRIRLFMAI